jgi:hypothetical protein
MPPSLRQPVRQRLPGDFLLLIGKLLVTLSDK